MTGTILEKVPFWFNLFLSDDSFSFLLTIESYLPMLAIQCGISKTDTLPKYDFSQTRIQ